MTAALKLSEKLYTYDDYLVWNDKVRRELVDGVVYNMASPTPIHQDVVLEIGTQLKNFLKGKKCKPYISPIDVRLNADKPFKKDDTVLQPDVLVLCDSSKIDEKGIKGAPDLVIEVLSPGSGRKDRFLKFKKYKEAGVREYWVVDINNNIVDVFIFEEDPHLHYVYAIIDPVPVRILEGCTINLSEILPPMTFDESLMTWEEPLKTEETEKSENN
jgi:Uma2 family endonuclease